jgi:hypothetical protein
MTMPAGVKKRMKTEILKAIGTKQITTPTKQSKHDMICGQD